MGREQVEDAFQNQKTSAPIVLPEAGMPDRSQGSIGAIFLVETHLLSRTSFINTIFDHNLLLYVSESILGTLVYMEIKPQCIILDQTTTILSGWRRGWWEFVPNWAKRCNWQVRQLLIGQPLHPAFNIGEDQVSSSSVVTSYSIIPLSTIH